MQNVKNNTFNDKQSSNIPDCLTLCNYKTIPDLSEPQILKGKVSRDFLSHLVLPEELELGDGDQVGAGPDLDKEELADGEDPGPALLPLILVLHPLVEGVRRVVAALRPNPLKHKGGTVVNLN
jgi:hypothetical protein